MPRRASVDVDRVGSEVVAKRRDGVRWKLLEREYGLCRARLWQLMRQAQDKDVYKHLSAGQAPEGDG